MFNLKEIKESEKKAPVKNNPWAICTKSVGRDDEDKYERCVKEVKKKTSQAQIKGNPLLVTSPENESLSIFPWAIGVDKKNKEKKKTKKAQMVLDRAELEGTIEAGDPSYIFHILMNRIVSRDDGSLFNEAIRKLLKAKDTDPELFYDFTARLIEAGAIELDDLLKESIKMDKEITEIDIDEEPPEESVISTKQKFNLRESQAVLDKGNLESVVEQGDPQSIFSLFMKDAIGRENQGLFDLALQKLINSSGMFPRGALMFLVNKGKIGLNDILERV